MLFVGVCLPLRKRGLGGFSDVTVKLVVELDGAQHLELGQAKYDAQWTRYFESKVESLAFRRPTSVATNRVCAGGDFSS
jgi:hypothetical protein